MATALTSELKFAKDMNAAQESIAKEEMSAREQHSKQHDSGTKMSYERGRVVCLHL